MDIAADPDELTPDPGLSSLGAKGFGEVVAALPTAVSIVTTRGASGAITDSRPVLWYRSRSTPTERFASCFPELEDEHDSGGLSGPVRAVPRPVWGAPVLELGGGPPTR